MSGALHSTSGGSVAGKPLEVKRGVARKYVTRSTLKARIWTNGAKGMRLAEQGDDEGPGVARYPRARFPREEDEQETIWKTDETRKINFEFAFT